MLVPGHVLQRVTRRQLVAQRGQGLVLRRFEGAALQPFELDADGVIVAIGLALPLRGPGVPGAALAIHKLQQLAAAANKVVRRHLQPADALKVGVRLPIERAGKQLLHLRAAILPRRQADRVQHQQRNARPRWARAVVRAGAEAGRGHGR